MKKLIAPVFRVGSFSANSAGVAALSTSQRAALAALVSIVLAAPAFFLLVWLCGLDFDSTAFLGVLLVVATAVMGGLLLSICMIHVFMVGTCALLCDDDEKNYRVMRSTQETKASNQKIAQ
ncbi:hypothetical protein [Acidithiobacillus marinus]|uniref:hypothetical protein n=1 Tax=Acidithiobacillus marinus TaxID=187490 RepID=UPI001C0F3719|nr:hypothetical protein [Acidithiobacillus marinus]